MATPWGHRINIYSMELQSAVITDNKRPDVLIIERSSLAVMLCCDDQQHFIYGQNSFSIQPNECMNEYRDIVYNSLLVALLGTTGKACEYARVRFDQTRNANACTNDG
jgi:hypothetical protein